MDKVKFSKNEFYHICNKSIANYGIFSQDDDTLRFLSLLEYCNNVENSKRLSYFLKSNKYEYKNLLIPPDLPKVKYLSFCIMKDHYHLLIKVIDEDLSKFIGQIENAYTRYFNIKYKRRGPLWQSRFRRIKITNNEQLLHVSRYVHLNPCTSKLVDKPEHWEASSYMHYINSKILENIKEISIRKPEKYKAFCENQIDYQRSLKEIKRQLLE